MAPGQLPDPGGAISEQGGDRSRGEADRRRRHDHVVKGANRLSGGEYRAPLPQQWHAGRDDLCQAKDPHRRALRQHCLQADLGIGLLLPVFADRA